MQNSAEDLYQLFEQFSDHFTVSSSTPFMNFVTSHSNSVHALEQLKYMKNKSNSFSQVGTSLYIDMLVFYEREIET